MIYASGYRAKSSYVINMKIWHILQFLNVDICWKLQSRIFKVKPDKTVSWIWKSSKSVKTFWHLEPKPVGRLTWFFRPKRKIVTELLVPNFKPIALKTSELLRFKVKVAPYIADRRSRIAHRGSRIADRASRIARLEILTYWRSLRSLKRAKPASNQDPIMQYCDW